MASTTSTSTVPDTTTTTVASTTTTTQGSGTQPRSLGLSSGWNLVGNSAAEALDVGSVFGDSSMVTTVWKWVASTMRWAFYTPAMSDGGAAHAANRGYDFLTTVDAGEGFWVNAKGAFAAQLPSASPISSTSQQVTGTGWSLIAIGDNLTPSQFNRALSLTTPGAGEVPLNLNSLWAWDNQKNNWYFYSPALEKSGELSGYTQARGYLDFGTKVLDPATGFWINRF